MEIHIFDPEVKGFTDPQSATIKHSRNQVCGILTDVADALQQSPCFLHAGGSTHVDWSLGSQGIHVLDRSLEDMFVEKRMALSAWFWVLADT